MTSDAQAVRAPALEMRGITKRYPGVVANDSIDLDVRPGEIHALLGENGAGKTTLMNILYGLARPDEGQILLDGTEVSLTGPSDAIARGINMVHQHFMLVPGPDRGREHHPRRRDPDRGLFLDRKEAHRRIVALGRQFGFEVDPEAKVGSLSVGWQQRVEILKALYRNARILVLDEPTAVLTPQETEEIFEVLRRLAAEGHSIVFISHKLYEVLEIADRITVIRRGRVVGERIPSETNEEDLAELMVGREVSLTVDRGDLARRHADPPGRGPGRPRRSRPGGRPRDRPRGRGRRDPGHRRRRRQRPGRARRGDHRPAQADRRPGRPRRRGHDRSQSARRLRGRRRLRAGRPASLRTGPVVQHRRQPGPDELPPPPVRPRHPAQRRRDLDAWPRSGSPPSTSGRRRPTPRPATLSGGNQQKVVVAREFARDLQAARARPADPRPRRRQHRVHPPPGRRQARRGDGRPAGLRRARRGPRAVRPDRGHLSRQARRHPRRTDGRQERGRRAHGDRRSRGGETTTAEPPRERPR